MFFFVGWGEGGYLNFDAGCVASRNASLLVGFGGWVVGVSNLMGSYSVAPQTVSREARRLGRRIAECTTYCLLIIDN